MRWYFKKKNFHNSIYEYNYSHENKEYDGLIKYDTVSETMWVDTPCKDDEGSEFAQKWSLRHFYKVIADNFPDTYSAITG